MSNLRRRDAHSPRTMSDSTKKWCAEMMNDVTAIDAFHAQFTSDDEGDVTDVIENDMIIKVMEDNMTYMQEAQASWSSFSLKSEDFRTLEKEVSNINTNYPDNVADWDDKMVDDALLDDDDIIVPQVAMSDKGSDGLFSDDEDDIIMPQVAMSDQGSDGLFSDDDDLMNPNIMANLYQVKEEVKEEAKEKADDTKGKVVMRWCFTMNNPSTTGDELAEKLKAAGNIKGFVFQLEEGANGTEHFQGYLEFNKAQRMSAVKKLLGENPHMEAANGNKASNLKYCTKEEGHKEGPWTWGTLLDKKNGNQGKRTDMDDFATMIEEQGGLTDDVIMAYPGHALQFKRQAKERTEEIVMKQAKEKEKAWWMEQRRLKDAGLPFESQRQMKCIFLIGPTAVGKTTYVKMETLGAGEDLYKKAGNNRWYPGYAGEKHMLVDEMTTGFCDKDIRNFNEFTNLGMNVQEIKGSHVLLEVETAWFTSNKHPLEIWGECNKSGTYKAFARRFSEVHWWNDDKRLIILKNPGAKEDAVDVTAWKKEYARWMSFWDGKPVPEGYSTTPGEPVVDYYTFGANRR